jgi:uncharacterized protein
VSRLAALGALVLLLAACGGDGDGESAGETQARTDAPPASTAELRAAVRANDVDAATRLLEAGADPNQLDPAGESPFLLAASRVDDDTALLEAMLEHGADVRAVDGNGDTALVHAARRGAPEAVGVLLEAGSPVDHVSDLGWTALLTAVILGDGSEPYVRTVERLLDAGASPTIGDTHGIAPLVHAETAGHVEIARLLREAAGES